MSILYVMCGAPGSGKSTWAKNFIKNHDVVYVSRDDIRMSIITDQEAYFSHEDEVYDKFISTIVANLCKSDVLADATHLSHTARLKLLASLDASGMPMTKYEIIFVQMDTSREECIKRDSMREGRQHVTAPVISRMYSQNTHPTINEFPNVKDVWIVK